jgi:maleate isomerase
MKTQAVTSDIHLDNQLPGSHFGLISLDCDQTVERDFMNMKPDEVSFYTSRVLYAEENTLENLKSMGARLSEAASLILPGEKLDCIAYACTSATVALGFEKVAYQISQSQPDIPVVTPMTASLMAFEHLGIREVSLLTPYRQNVSDLMTDYVIDHGYSVLNSQSFLLPNSSDLQRLSIDSIIAGAKQACHEKADALFIACTGIRALDVVEQLEEALQIPVLTSNQCMFWECLRHCGYSGSISGFGKLMRNI